MFTLFFAPDDYFKVDSSLNLITNNKTGLQTKLEPRLMEILCILVKNEGKLVRREQLISDVWDNYGGAEDGLNQGISFLRKALADTNKDIIKTVPKKGYILHATISDDLVGESTKPQKEKTLKNQPLFLATLFVIFSILSLIPFLLGQENLSEKVKRQPDSLLQSDFSASENWHGKNYKLSFDSNKSVILFENNIKIADSNLINFGVVIQELKNKISSEQDARR